ncbi:MAG: ATP-binding protein [Cyanobacteria bacterium P01_A01_bin.105]
MDSSGERSGIINIMAHDFGTLFERALHGIFQADSQGYYLKVNPTLVEMCGYASAADMLTAQPIANGQFYKDPHQKDRILQQLQTNGHVTSVEFQAYRQDGSLIWLAETCWALYDKEGTFSCYEGFVKDISDRKATEAALQYSEQQSKAIVTAIPDLMFRVSQDGTYLGFVNTNHFDNLLPDNYQPVGQPLSKYLPADVAARHQANLTQALATQTIQIYNQHVEVNGHWQHEEVRIVPIDNQEGLFIIRNVTQQKRAEAALRERNLDLKKALRQLQQAQNDLIQADKMVVLGQLVAGIAHEVNTPLGAIQAASGNAINALDSSLPKLPQLLGQVQPEQYPLLFQLIEAACQASPRLTAREKRQQRRALTQQLEAKGIAGARNLADTLVDMGMGDQIEPYFPLLESPNNGFIIDLAYDLVSIRSNSQTIQLAVEKASNVVKALKNFAHQDHTGQKVQAQVIDSIETVLTLYHNQLKQGIDLIREYDESLPPIPCYPDELCQIWTNLIQNAIQALGGRGTIRITVHQQPASTAPNPLPQHLGNCIVVAIVDNGPGIPMALQQRVFEPFFTTKAIGEGTGLGLNISRKIVTKHNGCIELTSEPGYTCFNIWLPTEEERSLVTQRLN